jgi:SAM-dependent methyltransferase
MRDKPEPWLEGLIPTLNQRGFMSKTMDHYSAKFAAYAGTIDDEVLDIGCAYGVATRAALDNGARVMACDMDAGHIEILEAEMPAELRGRLRTSVGLLPDVDYPDETFGAVLASRVLHFLRGPEVAIALGKMQRWLVPGGRVFLVADSPYTGFWSSIAPDYEKRKAAGDEWPAMIDDISTLLESGTVPDDMLPYLNPMDPGMLVRECERAGLQVEEARWTGTAGSLEGRNHAGCIARKI